MSDRLSPRHYKVKLAFGADALSKSAADFHHLDQSGNGQRGQKRCQAKQQTRNQPTRIYQNILIQQNSLNAEFGKHDRGQGLECEVQSANG